MSDKKLLKLFSFILILTSALCVFAQEQDEQRVRGAFLTTRINATTTAGATNAASTTAGSARKPRHRPAPKKPNTSVSTASNKPPASNSNANGKPASSSNGRPTNASVQTQSSTGQGNANAASGSNPNANASANASATLAPIGLGYTLYMRDEQNRAVRVDPAREFHAGDRIRLSLETNTDGFLYVFHTENDGAPRMIYPDARLDDGGNYVTAHVPYEIPDSVDKDERLHWFVFDAQPATERLYIVVTREPLAGVPVEDELVSYCQANKGQCPWQPQTEAWARIVANAAAKVEVVKSKSYGQAQTPREHDATTRGIGLDKTAPEPSIIRLSATASAPVLLTTVDLIHK
jgi:hypothetical protein